LDLWNMRDSDSGLLTREILLLGTPLKNWVAFYLIKLEMKKGAFQAPFCFQRQLLN
jgi:hypothetical protein